MALQHLRSSTANKRPLPSAMADGQLAVNTEATSPGLFFKNASGSLVKVGPVHVGPTAPNASPASGGEAGNTVGEQWLDTSGTNPILKVWDGSGWASEVADFVNANGDTMTGTLVMDNQQQVRFRETTANGTNFIAIQAPAFVAADRTLTLPDVTGTLVSTGDIGSVTSTMIANGTIVDADINASAAIAGSKISPNFGSQNVTTTGTSTAASFIPTSSTVPTNGVYLPAANSVGISANGSEGLRVVSTGAIGLSGANFGTAGQALISNGSTAPPSWQSITPTTVFGWNHTNDNYGLYLPGTSIRAGDLSGTIDIDVQSRLRRCVINDAGVVQYYLDADDSTKKAGDWLRIVETQSLNTAYTGTTQEATNSLLRAGRFAWAAGTFTRGQRVTHNGSLWECLATSTTAEPAAGTVASVLDGTDGQVMVEVPAFSVRYGFSGGVHTREVRLGCSDSLIAQGFQPHPAFIKADGTYKAAFYIGAYHAFNAAGNILASVSGQNNVVSITRATARSRAAARGTGWHIHSYLEHAAIQTLLVCEYRDHNSQKVVGNGAQEGAVYVVGTGLSNARGNRNGNAYTVGGANTDYVSYRGIENLWGRSWQWVDGFNVYERVVYLTNNQSAFADNTSVGYRMYAQVPSGTASYQKEIHPFPDVFLPSVVSGASNTSYLGDAMWTSTGWRVAYVGGASLNGALVGAFSLSMFLASGNSDTGVGARTCYAEN